jgi:putative Mg2+ transporter-C (MgtC) family protein
MDIESIGTTLLLLVAAALFGGIIGWQRELSGKAAGLRTHMLVSVGAAFFILSCQQAGFGQDSMSRVVQGIVTGIGFLGGGAILKGQRESEVQGLTTAASLWMATAIGIATGFGLVPLALSGSVVSYIILSILQRLESAGDKGPRTS